MDYASVPVTDAVLGRLNRMIALRDPATKMRLRDTVKEFVDDLNNDSSIKPIGDMVIGAHAASAGVWFIPLFPGQTKFTPGRPNNEGELTKETEYENLEQTTTALRRIAVDDTTTGYTAPPPTHSVHIKGCNLGRARTDKTRPDSTPFLSRFKQALGGHVLVTAPKHFQGVADLGMVKATGKEKGYVSYMCYEFSVSTPAVRFAQGGGFRGFADKDEIVAALLAAGYTYVGGAAGPVKVPEADWRKWVPKDISKSDSFYIALPLGRTVAGLKELVIKPDRKLKQTGAREFRVRPHIVQWRFAPPDTADTDAKKVAALKAAMLLDPRFELNHPWPLWERRGFATLDAYMAGHHWSYGEDAKGPLTTGLRFEYTVVLPILDTSGPKPKLVFNFYPGPATPGSAITSGLVETDGTYFAGV